MDNPMPVFASIPGSGKRVRASVGTLGLSAIVRVSGLSLYVIDRRLEIECW